MAISLNKGGNLSLGKTDPTLTHVLVGLGWDARSTDGVDFDLDASAFSLNTSGKVRGEQDFIFYNQPSFPEGSVQHTGAGDGDDESLKIDLQGVPADIEKVVITVTIHDAETRSQNFGQVQNAFIHNAEWKFRAVGQGYAGGLSALCHQYGINI